MRKALHIFLTCLSVLPMGRVLAQAPNLGTTANFVLFTTAGAITNTGASRLTGHVGANTGASTGFGNVDGVMHSGDGTTATAAADLMTAYNHLDTISGTFFPSTLPGGGDTITAGVYHVSSATTLDGTLILDAQGDAGAVFIFQIEGAFATSAASKVTLINGAQACNVFWKVEGEVSMGAGSTMRGTIIAHNAAIAISAADTLEGRALSIAGAITLNSLEAYKPIGCGSAVLTGPSAPALATTANYGIFSSVGPVTNAGTARVVGDVGTNSGLTTGFDPLLVTGMIHPVPDASTATCASDLLDVYDYLNTLAYDIELLYPAQFGNNLVITPHTYLLNAATVLTGNVYLNAQGNSDAKFVIQINGAFSTSTNAHVILLNGAKFSNVYWKIEGAADVADNSTFNGTMVVNNGAIHLRSGTVLNGRALTTTGAVTIDEMTVSITGPTDAGTINGPSTVCVGSTITLTDSVSGGDWSSSNSRATVVSGLVTGISAGAVTISYIVTNAAGADTATKEITVTNGADAGTITGPSAVCTGSTITLTDTATGGTWHSQNGRTTVVAGLVTGITAGVDTISYRVINSCGSDTAFKIVTVNPAANAGSLSGLSNVCVGSDITITPSASGGTWSMSNARATVAGGVVTGVSAGIDTVIYTVTNSCGTDTATKAITVHTVANAGTITGPGSVCVGSIITLSNTTTGGTWHSSNGRTAVVGGIVTGVTAGTDTILYVVSISCGTDTAEKIVVVNSLPNAGTITGASSVCTGSTITLSNTATGGTWHSQNGRTAVVAGVVTGITAGVDTISYRVTNGCGTDTAFKTVTVNPAANAGTLSGPSTVCVASSVTITPSVTGGTWSMSNTRAIVVSGVVTGVSAGIDTVIYTVTNGCGTDTVNKTITINALPNAGTTTGPASVCIGSVITLSNATTGGTWHSSNGRAAVAGGIVTGITAGTDTILYVVNTSCGADTAEKSVVVNPLPNAGTITGPTAVCTGSNITLSNTATGGTWESSNARATVAGGVVTGVTAGVDTIYYIVTNVCGTDSSSRIITINPLPNAGTLSGPSLVCTGTSITVTPTVSGGAWSATNSRATVAGGTVTGVSTGLDTIRYIVTNTCGSDTAAKLITVDTEPTAGVITGASAVCVATTIVLSTTGTGGTWMASNARATVAGGVVTGVSAGMDTIKYVVTNTCGTDTAFKAVNVVPFPNAGSISGPSTVCVGSAIMLTDTATMGAWSATNSSATVVGGLVTGVSAGIDTIMYIVTNMCGTDTASKEISVNGLPVLTSTTTPAAICDSSTFVYTPASSLSGTTYAWTRATVAGIANAANSGTASVSETLYNTTNTNKTVTYTYTLTALGCVTVQSFTVTVRPTPKMAILTDTACSGVAFTFTPAILTPGTTLTWVRNSVSGISGGTATGTGAVTDTLASTLATTANVIYAYTLNYNSCTFVQNVAITVFPAIASPVISTQSPLAVCSGTMYQNFGTATPAATYTTYNWSAVNATVWAQGTNSQYALINFTTPGTAQITLTAGVPNTSCVNQTTVTVAVGTGVSSVPVVTCFYSHFVCLPSDEDNYQWGYDDVNTLDSTILTGEINQDYVNTSPDFANKLYWVMTGRGDCKQKTYYTKPLDVQNVNDKAATVNVYPNPASNVITIEVLTGVNGAVTAEIVNATGQKVAIVQLTSNKTQADISALPGGIYFVTCIENGLKISGTRFTKL